MACPAVKEYQGIPLDGIREAEYHSRVIKSFRCRDTEALFEDRFVRRFQSFERVARRKLETLNAATSLEDLARIPGHRLEALKGNRAGQYSIRINDQWRLCFEWIEGHSVDVEIVDYH